jgi:hypothetical protein
MPLPTTKHPTLPVMIDLTTISTPKEQAIVAVVGKVGTDLIARATEANIRTLPIIDASGSCAGAISLQKLSELAASKTPLAPDHATVPCDVFPHLVPVTQLLQALAEHGLVLHAPDPDDDHGEQWFGIVTPADCNRPIFRAHVYQALVILETSLGQLIMDEFGDDWGAIRLLSDHTQSRIREFYDEERAEGVDLSPVTNATLGDLFHIATTSNNVWKLMGFDHPDQLRDVARQINELRNTIMHPVRPFIVNERELHEHAAALQAVDTLTAAIMKRIGVHTG